ncbi:MULTISPECIES: hypothetical protein [Myxococcus]|uniref:Uncharacterized protein n=1 Tax=Myxococcus llanfairpwllgwyngyllgogerychwyrndrobwllllantysiliogogogochensis TaxID=2590453 RepID=A0A540X2U7_9BACT|nr:MULTISPECIES: hypothetical protein [Myxococcus]NTX01020.1 hypothetical protein [Myxococcus sp. CA040A]NTX33291.1 hypothetical protein [Myxococcus sp. CA033]TQF15591.1 hypothetical protein FJV41_12825 [Myxococcus llanfairpwllgwyngyllgogerychwyrndrobwllllantysiliogogogochensis]
MTSLASFYRDVPLTGIFLFGFCPSGFAVGYLILLTWLRDRKLRELRFAWGLVGLIILVNPWMQAAVLEPINSARVDALVERARQAALEGRTQAEVERVLGLPSSISVPSSGPTVTWEYEPLPFYLLGGRLQVFFNRDAHPRVVGWERDW